MSIVRVSACQPMRRSRPTDLAYHGVDSLWGMSMIVEVTLVPRLRLVVDTYQLKVAITHNDSVIP